MLFYPEAGWVGAFAVAWPESLVEVRIEAKPSYDEFRRSRMTAEGTKVETVSNRLIALARYGTAFNEVRHFQRCRGRAGEDFGALGPELVPGETSIENTTGVG